MILKILYWVDYSKKSIYYKIIPIAPDLNTAGGFSKTIFSNAFMHASDKSMNPKLFYNTLLIPLTKPAWTNEFTDPGNISIKVDRH